MKLFYLLAATLILSLIPFTAISAQEKAAQAEVRHLMERFDKASLDKDIAFIDSVLAEEFSYSTPYGMVESRKDFLDFYRNEKAKPTFKAISVKNDDETIRIYGDTAVQTATWTLLTAFPKAHAGGQPHEDKGRSTVLLVKRDGGWKIALIHESEQQHDKVAMEKEVAALGRAYTSMIQKSDAAGIEKILADDYLVTDEEGRVLTKEQDLATYKDRAATIKFDSVEYKAAKGENDHGKSGYRTLDYKIFGLAGWQAFRYYRTHNDNMGFPPRPLADHCRSFFVC